MIFVSYSWHDQLVASEIENMLANYGAEYWIDKTNLDLSNCLKSQIKTALQQSNCILHLTSEASRSSSWVLYETKIAYKLGKKIFEIDVNADNKEPNKKIQLTVGSAVRFQRSFLYQNSVLCQNSSNICQRHLI